jgi:hypothetical protein
LRVGFPLLNLAWYAAGSARLGLPPGSSLPQLKLLLCILSD